jgi:hypothetical protein
MMTGQSEIVKGVREGLEGLQARATQRVRPTAERARKATEEYRRAVDELAKKARAQGRVQVGALAGGLRKVADRLDVLVKAEAN